MTWNPTFRGLRLALSRSACAALVATLLALPAPARADEVTDANQKYTLIRPALRSDAFLLPALAKLAPTPKSVIALQSAMLLPAGGPGWDECAAWAKAAPQQAAIDAVRKAASVQDWKNSYAFGQPYGINDVEPALIKAKLYTELGDPPLLAAAKMMHMNALDALASLVHVEATRLVAEKKSKEACNLMIDWAYFARSMTDRVMYKEVKWGFTQAAAAFERVRDLAYEDLKSRPALKPEDTIAMIARLDDTHPQRGYMDLSRVPFPDGDRLAARQLTGMVYSNDGFIDERNFGPTMSRLGASERPLRLFGDAGRWSGSNRTQAAKGDVLAQIEKVFGDWKQRWKLNPFEPVLGLPSDYSKTQKGKFAALEAVVQDMSDLFDLRLVLRAELVGTRTSLGAVGVYLERGSWPNVISAMTPRFLPINDVDPFHPDSGNKGKPDLEYFVPGTRGTAAVHEMDIVPSIGANFKKAVKGETCIIYSVGGNNKKDGGRTMQNTAAKADVADYLIWPPRLSLTREAMTR